MGYHTFFLQKVKILSVGEVKLELKATPMFKVCPLSLRGPLFIFLPWDCKGWFTLISMLRANPCIHHFKLVNCTLSSDQVLTTACVKDVPKCVFTAEITLHAQPLHTALLLSLL